MMDQNKQHIKDAVSQSSNRGNCRITVRMQTQEEERRFTNAVNTFLAEWVRQRISQEDDTYVTAKD